jgi:hypothetical protein
MVLFMVVSFINSPLTNGRGCGCGSVPLGLVGTLLVVCATVSAFGFTSWAGVDFNATSLQVLPFLALGLGMDDVFIIIQCFDGIRRELKRSPTPQQNSAAVVHTVRQTFRRAGTSMAMTSLANFCAFLVGSSVPLPAARCSSLSNNQPSLTINCNAPVRATVRSTVFGCRYIEYRILPLRGLLFATYEVGAVCGPRGWCRFYGRICVVQESMPPHLLLIVDSAPLLKVNAFCLQAAAVVAFNFVFVMLGMAAALSVYDHTVRRRLSARHFGADQVEPSTTTTRATSATSTTSTTSTKERALESVVHASPKDAGGDGGASRASSMVSRYAGWLTLPWLKAVVIIVFVGLIAVTGQQATTVLDGLDVKEVAPKDSHLGYFLDAKFTHFSSYDAYIKTKPMDFPCRQQEFLQFLVELRNMTQWVAHVKVSWLELYLTHLHAQADKARVEAEGDGISGSGSTGGAAAAAAVAAAHLTADGLCEPTVFYSGLADWDADISAALDVLSAGLSKFSATADGKLAVTSIEFTLHNLHTTSDYAQMISDVRGLMESYAAKGVQVYPQGIPFEYWEQYIRLREYFWTAVGICFAVVFVAVLPFLSNPVGALIVVAVVGMVVVEIFGLMGTLGIKFSAIPAVTLIMSIGMAVQFVAHIVLCFLVERGVDRDARMVHAMQQMLIPVSQGGLSTFFSIVILGFSEFQFVQLYFFGVFVMVVVVGLLNGLVLLPVVLSLVGPTDAVAVHRLDG